MNIILIRQLFCTIAIIAAGAGLYASGRLLIMELKEIYLDIKEMICG